MLAVGVISNRLSLRNRRDLAGLSQALAGRTEARHAVLDGVAGLGETLADFARREIGLLVVSGGDGTVQATLTALFRERPFAEPPPLAVLPRGTTNMIAADAGVGPRRLESLLELARGGGLERHLVERRVLRLENARGQPPQYGMFFGGAGIHRAVVACRDRVHPWKLAADAAAAVTLAGLVGGWLLGGRRENASVRGDCIGLAVDGRATPPAPYLLVLATTLDRLLLGSRPFWNDGGGDFRFTAIAYPPPRLLRNARAVLYGGAERRLPAGYDSAGARRVELAMDCPFIVDGEAFEAERRRPICLTAPERARFVRL